MGLRMEGIEVRTISLTLPRYLSQIRLSSARDDMVRMELTASPANAELSTNLLPVS
jgi:hypothetical protein